MPISLNYEEYERAKQICAECEWPRASHDRTVDAALAGICYYFLEEV